jgi:putative ABC transport system permease protein
MIWNGKAVCIDDLHGAAMSDVLARVQREVLAADPRIRWVRAQPLSDMVASELRQWRLGATLFTLFGLLALLVAGIGLYSVLAFDVAHRVREIGLRTALGATHGAIMRLVLSRAARMTAAGLAAGAAIALVLAPRLSDMLYEIDPRDPIMFAVVAATLALVSLVAAGIPAWRAARVDPNVALRAE